VCGLGTERYSRLESDLPFLLSCYRKNGAEGPINPHERLNGVRIWKRDHIGAEVVGEVALIASCRSMRKKRM